MAGFREFRDVPRFQLDRRPGRSRLKTKCPSCGKERCLTLYVDVETGQPVGDTFGRCDHERTCGYDHRPTGRDVGDKDLWTSGNKCIKAFAPPSDSGIANCIPFSEFARTINPNEQNPMFKFLASLWGKERVSDIFRRYYVGTMDLWNWKGCSVFWQIDKNFVCRTGKVMEYNIKVEDGKEVDIKRVKEGPDERPHVMYYHSIRSMDFILKQCLFGEHLLSLYPKDKVVNLVEAEKTAIICAINKPDEIFIATGGLQNMRFETAGVLTGRRVVIFPDKGSAYDVWKERAGAILPGFNTKVSDYLQDIQDLPDGADVADLIIRNKIKERDGKLQEQAK